MQSGSQLLLTFASRDFGEKEHESSMLQPARLRAAKSVKEKSRRKSGPSDQGRRTTVDLLWRETWETPGISGI
jgi:hypothetical protein